MNKRTPEEEAEWNNQRQEDYEEWRNSTEFLPLEKFEEVVERPNLQLPLNGSYYIIANNIDEVKAFLAKIEDLDPWKQVQILKSDDDTWDESMEMDPDGSDGGKHVDGFTLYYNQYYDKDKRLQVHKQEDLFFVNPNEIQFNEDFLSNVTFPCMVQHCYDGGSDRIGNFEVIHCGIYNLPGVSLREGPPKIQLNWI